MDKSFLAFGTILHRAPKIADSSQDKRKGGSQGDRDPLSDIPEGWIRVAL